ncbi:VanZ family protein [Amaricoccus solimangrovi]|uniref:VanZ family protein n=1 Tax=Amaricoccus solimangrovi TaxID=2589815 RepID=A0A501WUQ9_9RHOB|nr:VanZ family protein [Amaricoccus solimangrovi]TPE52130.1 VanZ family protein [Amaricoccus solimangrovi]
MRYLVSLNQRYWPVLVLVLLVLVTAGSLDPGHEPLPGFLPWDKARHFLAYAAVAFPIALARPRRWGWMMLGLLGWGLAIEFIQPAVGRDQDMRDFLANSSGVLLAVLLSETLRRLALAFRRGVQSLPLRRISPFDGS